jgi:hypothetical protein
LVDSFLDGVKMKESQLTENTETTKNTESAGSDKTHNNEENLSNGSNNNKLKQQIANVIENSLRVMRDLIDSNETIIMKEIDILKKAKTIVNDLRID